MTKDDLHSFLTASRGYEDKTDKLLTKRKDTIMTNGELKTTSTPEKCYVNKDEKKVVFVISNVRYYEPNKNKKSENKKSENKKSCIISVGTQNEPVFYPFKKAYDQYKKDYQIFFLSVCSDSDNVVYKDIKRFVVSIEPLAIPDNDISKLSNTTITLDSNINELSNKISDSLLNRIPINENLQACFICVDWIEDGKSERKYTLLDFYLSVFDSRTYKDTVYYPVYKSVLSSLDESNDERLPHNLLVYGAPGTGKSYYINNKFLKCLDNYKPFDIADSKQLTEEDFKKMADTYEKEFGEKMSFKSDDNSSPNNQIYKAQNDFRNKYLTRVTFYEDYSYENFVGCYKPVEDDETGKITYKFEAGSFIDIYIKAKKNPDKPYLLAIEEINRANAAAVFGDLFQVLDRDDNGNSEYSVKPEAALNKYLEKNLAGYDGTISLPSNLYIWATMNSADQGVHVLDSAFKRRWQFLYMDINNSESAPVDDKRKIVLPVKNNDGNIEVKTYTWDSFRTAVNKVLEDNKIEEDRWVGAWFFKQGELDLIKKFYTNKDNTKLKPNPLVDKLLAYLLQDVVKMNKDILFEEKYHNMSSIRKDLSNSTSPKNIFDVLKIDKSTLKEIQETEPPTPTDTAVTENG